MAQLAELMLLRVIEPSLNPVIVNFYWTFINRKDKINEKKAETDPLKKQ